jgi:hypothetical protein
MSGLGRELVRSLAELDVVPRLVAQRPRQEWRVGALTVVVGKQRAEVKYARESAGWAKPNAPAIVDALVRARDRLIARSLTPDALLPKLVAAYTAILARRRGKLGDRAPLVDVRDELEYVRAQFAWDMARLVREQRLVVDGRRIDLGVATANATAQRSRVVWIEGDSGRGAFYESFRLIPSGEVRS